MFDSTNTYYADSSSLPLLAAPHFAQTIKINKQLDIRQPKYNRIQAARCQITLLHKTKLNISGTHPILPKNPFMVKVNLKDDEQVNKEIEYTRKHVKQIKQILQEQSRPFFSSMMPNLIMNLIMDMDIDITFQRGQNPFIHKHDFTQNQFHVLALFKNQTQCSFILKILDELFVTSRIRLVCLEKQFQYESLRFQTISKQQHHTNLENFKFLTSSDILNEISTINKDLLGEGFQVAYIDFPKSNQIYLYQLYLSILILSTLQDHGCFVFRTKHLHLPQINYFLYLYAQVFHTVILEKSDENHSLLQNSIYVGCYGYNQHQGREYINDLLRSFDCLRIQENYGLFDYKIMPADNDFEKELTQFQSSLHKHRKAQLEVFQWSAQQLENDTTPEQVAQFIIKDREKAKIEKKESKEKKEYYNKHENRGYKSNNHYNNNNNYNKDNRNHEYSNSYKKQAYNPQLMNPTPQVQQIQTELGASPDIIRRNKPQSHKVDSHSIPVFSKEKIKEKEQIKLEKLLNQEQKKEKKKDTRDERLSRFQR